jgi:UDPglucose--hexose-1-phosphate uridylyltransferase
MRQTCRGRTEAEIWQTLLLETGRVFVGVLEDAGVYKQTPAGKAGLERFLKTL